MTRERERHVASIATARAIPPLLALIVAYTGYVVVGPLAVDYLINPPPGRPARVAAGLAIPIVYLVLLIPVAITWLRLLVTVWTDPGYIAQRPELPPHQVADGNQEQPPGLEDFWTKDVFVCDSNGLPFWCDKCRNWKPDRTHHNQDTGRCTRKMDHFCPWVGGVVGERSLKFFIQFLFYTVIFTLYLLIVFAYFVAERKKAQWCVVLGLAGFFFMFTAGMVINSLHLVSMNYTTIEHIRPYDRQLFMAVVLPPELQADPLPPPPPAVVDQGPDDDDSERRLTSELDDPSRESYFKRQSHKIRQAQKARRPEKPRTSSGIWKNTITYPLNLPTDRPPLPAPNFRKFAVLKLPLGMNPWNLGTPWGNFTSVFGRHPHDWFLPYHHSPCCDHSSAISEFPLGPQFEQLILDAGLQNPPQANPPQARVSSSRRKRKRRLDPGWQNGERPNGWLSEKEARRIRNDWRKKMRAEQTLE